jgi:nanoRNase/pAp phosphatase (c-di-AMP/oligoRNAs hydrolase)
MLNLEEQIINQVNKAKNILIVFNSNANGDAIASSLALFLFLKKINKKATVASAFSQEPEKSSDKNTWSFLPSYNVIENNLKNLRKFIVSLNIRNAKISQIKYNVEGEKLNFIIAPEEGWFSSEDVSSASGGFEYDLIFTINTPDLESLGQLYDNNVEFFYKTTIINLDHQANNEEYGQINYLDINVSSSAEIIFKLINSYDKNILDEDIATCLLTGIIAKTNNYKSPNLTPLTLLTSSKLISAGAQREKIINSLYRSRSLSSLKTWGKILNNLKNNEKKTIAWSLINQTDEDLHTAESLNLHELAEEILNGSTSTKILLINIISPDQKSAKLSIFSNKSVSAIDIFKSFSAQGNKQQAKIELTTWPLNWQEEIISPIEDYLAKNPH